jgi:hypothetical protein
VEVEIRPSTAEERPIKLLNLDKSPWAMNKASDEVV